MKKAWVVIALGFALLTGVSAKAGDSVLLVGEGGWESCRFGLDRQFIEQQFQQLVSNLRSTFPHKQFSTLTTCTGLRAAYGNTPIPYRYSDGRRNLRGEIAANAVDSLISHYRGNSEVFLIGHSHGGWLAMNAAAGLSSSAGLFTIEPISAAQCDVRDFLRNRSKRPIPRRQDIRPGCRQAPYDVDTNAVVRSTAGVWYNYHLGNQFKGDLYSSAAAGAMNVQFSLLMGDEAHHRLGLDYRVWTDICYRISGQLGASKDSTVCKAIEVDHDGRLVRRLN